MRFLISTSDDNANVIENIYSWECKIDVKMPSLVFVLTVVTVRSHLLRRKIRPQIRKRIQNDNGGDAIKCDEKQVDVLSVKTAKLSVVTKP